MNVSAPPGYEPWSRVGFGLVAVVGATTLLLAARPGGELSIGTYLYAPTALGLATALWLVVGVVHAARRPPALAHRRLHAFVALALAFWWCSFPLAYPSSYEGSPSRTRVRLPFEGEWEVRFGGDRRQENAYVLQPHRRFAVHFDPPEGAGSLVVPAAGTLEEVLRLSDGEPRLRLRLRLSEGEYLYLEGLTVDSILPPPGQRLTSGEPLGRVGAFGLVVHLQDTREIPWGEGIPLRFEDYSAGGRPVTRGAPRRGQRVKSSTRGVLAR